VGRTCTSSKQSTSMRFIPMTRVDDVDMRSRGNGPGAQCSKAILAVGRAAVSCDLYYAEIAIRALDLTRAPLHVPRIGITCEE